MLFHSQAFILGFLPLCLAGFFLTGRWAGPHWALGWLIAASLVFYGWWNPVYVPLLVGSILVNHAIGVRISALVYGGHRAAAKRWMAYGVAADLAVLAWFKYADFLLRLAVPDAASLGVVLPLAISFFTFQQIMFLVDRLASERDCPDLLHYAAFVAFFPHLIAGPLVRPRDIIPQLSVHNLATPNSDNLTTGIAIFLVGLAKKLVLADMFGGFADIGFNAADQGQRLTLLEAWPATLSYALQIYFDFSAYSDMATGLARMLGVRFPLNFASPYQARNIADFWRRWHITLGLFLRDHVYVPLGGNRLGVPRQAVNLMLTMLLAGLWHGAAWRFVLWGGLHGAMLVGHMLFRRLAAPMPAPLAHALTLLGVILAWVPFRANGFDATLAMACGLLGLNGIAVPTMIAGAFPAIDRIATRVPVLPFLGDARTLSLPEVFACLTIGWFIVLALPHALTLSERARCWAIAASFALTMQALFFAPQVAPFLYFRF